ncbi:MAG: O-antigen ligase family protein, partial [Candidatus Magasanikbacteria bacterium]
MNSKTTITKFFVLYFAIRLFSYFFSPQTPLVSQHPLNTIVSALIFVLAIYLLIKKDERGWYVVAGEIILGGSGGYLRLDFVSLRTALLLGSVTIFFIQKIISEKTEFFKQLKLKQSLILILIGMAGLAAMRGLYMNHEHSTVFSNFVPYLFLLYYFPLRELWLSDRFRELGKNAIVAAVFGNALMILLTQIGLSSGLFILQDNYYHWYRDVALGKITDLNFHFYRLVLNEHLLLVPLSLYFIGDIIKNKVNKINVTALVCLLFILANNLSRIYLVALFVGTLVLFYIKNWKRWLAVSFATAIGFILIFTISHTLASRGQSFGLEIFGLRLQSIASPQMEDSSLSRLLLLPKILEKIKQHPFLGSGLGDTVTVYSPVFKTNITTPNFDWGYLEIFAEMGLFGLLIWLILICYLFKNIIKNSQHVLFAILISFLIINITSPALFHVLGIILITFIMKHHGLTPVVSGQSHSPSFACPLSSRPWLIMYFLITSSSIP